MKIDLKIAALKRYFWRAAESKTGYKMQLLSGHEALKQFGSLYGTYQADMMMMLTSIEYKYITDNDPSADEFRAAKKVLGEVALFLRDCKREYDMSVAIQEKRAQKK